MAEIVELLADVVGAGNVLAGDAVAPDYAHDEALTATPSVPLAVVRRGAPPRCRPSQVPPSSMSR